MRRYICILLVLMLLLVSMPLGASEVSAAKATQSRTIAIVFDNSGSMYLNKELAWCRATYAMEVFASMLNAGDLLQIYPMHPFTVNGKQYDMSNPFQITDAAQAASIREILTPEAMGTPIESIDSAAAGLKAAKGDKKYMIVLTDGTTFHQNGVELSSAKTKAELDARIQKYAGNDMTLMYLGIDVEASKSSGGAIMPGTAESASFIKRKASNSADILSILTFMCNQIFGRDTLPESRITNNNKTVEFDISMKKMIVFVQGENIGDLKLSGDGIGRQVSSQQTKYSTKGAEKTSYGACVCEPDRSLQGMMVTYTDCAAGTYTIEHSGTVSSVEVYYEPDADLDFVFTDSSGNTVDPNALYEGEYKVSFGMKDARTGKLISSELLGQTQYSGTYTINGEKKTFTSENPNDIITVTLNMGDTFEAELTVTYLSGYTIHKDSTDFGWPKGGITVAARPAGDMKLEITGGQDVYSLQDLKEGASYTAKVFYKGQQLTGDALKSVELKWNPATSNAEVKQEFADDHFKLWLDYKDPEAPQDTVCGQCTVVITAFYTEQGSSTAQAQAPLTYNIKDDFSPLRMELTTTNDYIVISELESSEPITVSLKLNGAKLTPEDFAAVELLVDCGGIQHTVTPNPEDSSYTIKLLPTEGIAEDDYLIKVTAVYTDHIGRQTQVEGGLVVTLSVLSLLTKWLIGLGIFVLAVIAIWVILHIRVFPSTVRADLEGCNLKVGEKGGDPGGTEFFAKLSGNTLEVRWEYGGETMSVSMSGLEPGKDSYLYKRSHKRSIRVADPNAASYFGDVKTASFDGSPYILNKEGNLVSTDPEAVPFVIRNDATVVFTGKVLIGASEKNTYATIPITFRKQ